MASRKRIPEIEFPDHSGETTATIIGTTILFISIDVDQFPTNPCKEFDGVGAIRSFSHRHIDNIDPAEAIELMKSDEDVIPLSYFEHGQSLWMVKELPSPAGVEFQWDGVRFAGVWIPDQCVRDSYMGQDGLTRRQWMVKQAESACEQYTQFCNGDIYCYDVTLHTVRKDDDGEAITEADYYSHHKAISEDSCCGFFGWEYAIEEVRGQVKSILKDQKFSRRAISAALREKEVA